MPRNGKAQGSVNDEKHVEFVNENNEARQVARRLDKRHGFLAQIQNIQHSRDDYEQEYQQKRKERMMVAQKNEAKEREMIMAREREEKERKVKESEEKERKLKEREDFEQRTKVLKKDQLTRADLVAHWGHEGFAEQQKREKLQPRRLSHSARGSDSPRLSKDSGDSSWDTRSEQTTSSLEEEFVVRKPSKLEMYVPPRRAVVTMESNPIIKPAKYPVEKLMKGRGENKYGKQSVSSDSQSTKRIPSITDAKQNDFQPSAYPAAFHSSGEAQSSIKESRRDESDKNLIKPDKLSIVLRGEKAHSTKNVQQAAEAPKIISLNRKHARVGSGDESNRSVDKVESRDHIGAEDTQQPSPKDHSCGRDERHSHPLHCGKCVPRSLCCNVYDKIDHNHYCVESQFHEHSHRCNCTRPTLQNMHCRADDKGCNHSLGHTRDTQRDCSRTAKCNPKCHGSCRSDQRHYDLSIEPSCMCHQCGIPTDGQKGSLSPVRSVDTQEDKQVRTKEKKKVVKKKKKKTEEAVLIMSIELGGEIKKLRYYESETVLDSALAFCKKYNFGGENQKAFAGALAEHLRRHLNE